MELLTIKQIRVGLGWTQKQMAKYLGISTVSYQRKESGNEVLDFGTIQSVYSLC